MLRWGEGVVGVGAVGCLLFIALLGKKRPCSKWGGCRADLGVR